MKTILPNLKRNLLVWLRIDAICELFGEAILCAFCGFLYGVIFGGIGAQLHRDSLTIITIAATAAGGGFVIGLAGSVLRNVLEND